MLNSKYKRRYFLVLSCHKIILLSPLGGWETGKQSNWIGWLNEPKIVHTDFFLGFFSPSLKFFHMMRGHLLLSVSQNILLSVGFLIMSGYKCLVSVFWGSVPSLASAGQREILSCSESTGRQEMPLSSSLILWLSVRPLTSLFRTLHPLAMGNNNACLPF